MELKKFIISPPFGTYVGHKNATRVMGSFTYYPRPGRTKQILKTLRPTWGGWVNAIGLRNPGIQNVPLHMDRIYSLAAIHQNEWDLHLSYIPNGLPVEINIGCPNANATHVIPFTTLKMFLAKTPFVCVKLPPTDDVYDLVEFCLINGVRYIHLCNTLPTERGGESGKNLRSRSLEIIKEVRKRFGERPIIIGGGGIYSRKHVKEYHEAGANHFSLATICFRPWRALIVMKNVECMSAKE